MRTIRTKVYKFSELSKQAKENAVNNYRNEGYYNQFYFEEVIESCKAMAYLFDLKFGRGYTDIRCSHINDDILELKGIRLLKYVVNNYWQYLFKGKYYGKLVDTFKDGSKIPVSKEHPAGLRHVKRYSKCTFENSCTLTGVCYDNDILQPVYDFLKRPGLSTTFEDLIKDIENAIQKTFDEVQDWINSDEFIQDEIEANEYEFTADGRRF